MKIMKKFIRYYRPYRKVFLFDMICAFGISIIDLAFPQILNYLNATLYLEDPQTIRRAILVLAAGLLVMYLVRAACKYYVSAQGHIMGARMERDMRKELFDQYERLSFSYYDKNNTGECVHFPAEDHRLLCSALLDPCAADAAAGGGDGGDAAVFAAAEQAHAGDLHGESPQDRGCQRIAAGYAGRHPGRKILCE